LEGWRFFFFGFEHLSWKAGDFFFMEI